MKIYNWSAEQISAMKRINRILREMILSNNEDEVFDLYCEADDLWNKFFPFEAAQKGDAWRGTRWFNDKVRALKKNHFFETVNVTINGNINVVYGDFTENINVD